MTTRKAVWGLVALFAIAAPAVSLAADLGLALVAGYDTGGDKIVTVTFTNGETDSLRANEGLYLGAGISVINDDKNIEFLGTVSYKFASIHANNGDVDWTRVPLDAIVFYRWPNFRAGAGLTYVMSPKLTGAGAASGLNVKVDDALGFLVQADYLVGKVNIGLRGTFVDYKAGGNTAKGSGVGVTVGVTF
ncbi:MAG TPA: hypothetical protein VLV56_02020 [Burkholderiales bacterium]|nr:hypothetical protein [Burkholderiales bacterium]